MDKEQLQIVGPIHFTGPDGYKLDTHDATADLKARTLQSGGAVTGAARQGRFSANRLHADLDGRIVRLDGDARLRIFPKGGR